MIGGPRVTSPLIRGVPTPLRGRGVPTPQRGRGMARGGEFRGDMVILQSLYKSYTVNRHAVLDIIYYYAFRKYAVSETIHTCLEFFCRHFTQHGTYFYCRISP